MCVLLVVVALVLCLVGLLKSTRHTTDRLLCDVMVAGTVPRGGIRAITDDPFMVERNHNRRVYIMLLFYASFCTGFFGDLSLLVHVYHINI